MGTQRAIVIKSTPQAELPGQISFEQGERSNKSDAVYARLAATLFETTAKRTVVAFVSVHSGAGVTHVVHNLATTLNRSGRSVVVRDGDLCPPRLPGLHASVDEFETAVSIAGTHGNPETESTAQTVNGLRGRHDCVLLDCGSLDGSAGLIRLGRFCDGVVLVAEAGKASKAQMDRAIWSVRQAQGALLGIVLNKRQYPIPEWLYRLL